MPLDMPPSFMRKSPYHSKFLINLNHTNNLKAHTMFNNLENLNPLTKDAKLIADIANILFEYNSGLTTESECANKIYTTVYEYAG